MKAKDLSPIPPGVANIMQYIYAFASVGDLGVVSAKGKGTGTPRFTLVGRYRDAKTGKTITVPLGLLIENLNDQIVMPEELPAAPVEVTINPDVEPQPMSDLDATMIAEGVYDADEDTQLRAWQHLEDTGLGYKLQGWFGRKLQRLIEEGSIRPRHEKEEADA